MATDTTITIKYGKLTEQLRAYTITRGTILGEWLKRREIPWSASIRVNAETATKDQKLAQGDIITCIDDVDGGC